MTDYRIILSERGLPLMLTHVPAFPTITIENYLKWYTFYVVFPDGRAEAICAFDHGVATESPYGWSDHIPHPRLLRILAEKLGYEFDRQAEELIAGRWALEHRGEMYEDSIDGYIIPNIEK